jgi:hypothetical protein
MVLQCAYGRKDDDITCLTLDELKEMASSLKNLTGKEGKKQLYKKLLDHNKVKNDTELILKYKNFDINKILKPKKPGFYLSNTDIDIIFDQFAKVHPEFMSYGGVPYDFWEKPEGSWKKNCDKIYKFDIKKFIDGGKTKWGMVTNLSKSDSEGSHWVCMYFEVNPETNKAELEYFDSIGANTCRSMSKCVKITSKKDPSKVGYIPEKINEFIERVEYQCKEYCKEYDFSVDFNKQQQQKGNNECGMYCIYYIYNRLLGKIYNDKDVIPDEKMTYLRNVLFKSPHYCNKCNKYKKSIKILQDKYEI